MKDTKLSVQVLYQLVVNLLNLVCLHILYNRFLHNITKKRTADDIFLCKHSISNNHHIILFTGWSHTSETHYFSM